MLKVLQIATFGHVAAVVIIGAVTAYRDGRRRVGTCSRRKRCRRRMRDLVISTCIEDRYAFSQAPGYYKISEKE
jgi:hypothetical protein